MSVYTGLKQGFLDDVGLIISGNISYKSDLITKTLSQINITKENDAYQAPFPYIVISLI